MYKIKIIKKIIGPSILSKWFNERLEYKKLAKKYGNEGNKKQYEYFNHILFKFLLLFNIYISIRSIFADDVLLSLKSSFTY